MQTDGCESKHRSKIFDYGTRVRRLHKLSFSKQHHDRYAFTLTATNASFLTFPSRIGDVASNGPLNALRSF